MPVDHRRGFAPANHDQVKPTPRWRWWPARTRRADRTVWRGAALLFSFLCLTCSPVVSKTERSQTDLIIGAPEGTELGVSQAARFLTLDGLTQLTVDGRAVPRLASDWRWEDGGLRLRVVLPPQVTFHDGTALTPTLLAEILGREISDPANRTVYPSLTYVKSVEASGDGVVLNLSEPAAFLPEDLEIWIELDSPSRGTGPFRVVSRTPQEIVLERFGDYRGGSSDIRRVIVKPFPTLRTAWTSLLRGEVDVVTDVPPDAVEFIRNDDVQVISFERRYQFLIAFNSRRPPLSSPLVRRALNLAIDRDALVQEVLHGRGNPSTGPLWPKYWAYDPSVAPYPFDPAQAAALLDEAGLRMPSASPDPSRPPARLRLTCLVPENFNVWERIALKVQRDLFDIGVDIQFRPVPLNEFGRLLQTGRFEAVLNDMVSGPTPGRAYIFWRSTRALKGPYNIFGYENEEAERLFDILQRSTNDAAIRSATRRLQRVFLDDPPALFLAWTDRARAIRREFLVPEEPGRDPMLSVGRWQIGPVRRASAASP